MESWMFNDGLRHIPQKIFGHLDHNSLLAAREVHSVWKRFVDDLNQEWREPWIEELKMVLKAKVYFGDKQKVNRRTLSSKWKKICHYFQNCGTLPEIIVITQCLNEIQIYARWKRTATPRNPIMGALALHYDYRSS